MALFMDIHTMEGPVAASDVAASAPGRPEDPVALRRRLQAYWVDEANGRIFCLVEAPDAEAAVSVHREAHGLLADAIYPVAEGV